MNIRLQTYNAIMAAVAGGYAAMKVYEREIEVNQKDDRSPVTAADLDSNRVIMDMLKVSQLPVLSEEGKNIDWEERSEWEYFWMVDPLDGTKEFINRNGEFTINVALIHKNQPVAGVVYVPVRELLYFGIRDEGAWKTSGVKPEENPEPEDVEQWRMQGVFLPEQFAESGKIRVVGSRSHQTPETEAFVNDLRKQAEVAFVTAGSSLKFCLVAEGSADIYPRFGPTMEWDTAAGHAVAAASGCRVTHAETGEDLVYNKQNLLNPWFLVQR